MRVPAGFSLRLASHPGKGRVPIDQVAVACRAVRTPQGQEVDGLQQVGLALGVFADKDVEHALKGELQRLVIAKLEQFDRGGPAPLMSLLIGAFDAVDAPAREPHHIARAKLCGSGESPPRR